MSESGERFELSDLVIRRDFTTVGGRHRRGCREAAEFRALTTHLLHVVRARWPRAHVDFVYSTVRVAAAAYVHESNRRARRLWPVGAR